jgi:hypothetical protein
MTKIPDPVFPESKYENNLDWPEGDPFARYSKEDKKKFDDMIEKMKSGQKQAE